jgi:hypothetical protein
MIDPDLYKPTSPMMGVWLFFISKRRYLNAAVEHGCWLNLQASDLRKKYLEGSFLPDSDETRSLELKRFESLRSKLWRSLRQVTLVTVLALLTGVTLGAIDISFPFNQGKVLTLLGTFLATWAALFELGGPSLASWKGESLSEIVHPMIFQMLFISGTFVLMGAIIL